MKKVISLSFLVLLIGCSFISCDNQSKAVEKLKKNFINAGYSVTEYDTILDNVKVLRILAVKDNSYFDVCFNVAESDINKINSYYATTYNNYYKLNCNSGKGIVVCCSDKTTYDISGISIVELKPIVVN